jgi:hypothetical protein
MRKCLIALLVCLIITQSSFARIFIKIENRVPNRTDYGYCAWACLATLGRQQKIKVLYDLLDQRAKEFTWQWDGEKWIKSPYVWTEYGGEKIWEHRAPGSHSALASKLKSLGVKFRYQWYGNNNKDLIKEAVENKKGCLVVVKAWEPHDDPDDTHAIVIVDYNKEGIEFYDPNNVESLWTAKHDWFNSHFTGYVLVLD